MRECGITIADAGIPEGIPLWSKTLVKLAFIRRERKGKRGIKGMPREQEEIMISRDMLLAKLTGGHIHIAHVSSAWSLKLIEIAKKEDINITCEVCPHHFTFDDSYLENYDTNYKMSPPLRTKADVEAMREGLKNGVIDIICTDHARHSFSNDKPSDFKSFIWSSTLICGWL